MTQCNQSRRRPPRWPLTDHWLTANEPHWPPAVPWSRHAPATHIWCVTGRQYDVVLVTNKLSARRLLSGPSFVRRTTFRAGSSPYITTALDSPPETDNCLSAEHPTYLEINLVSGRCWLRLQKPIFGDERFVCARVVSMTTRTCARSHAESAKLEDNWITE